MAANLVKIKQIDGGELGSFIDTRLNVVGGSHTNAESFLSTVSVLGNTTTSGNFTNKGVSVFETGIFNKELRVSGNISGDSLTINSFNMPVGSLGTAIIGNCSFTGIPIYDSGDAAIGTFLSSGSMFGVKQRINAPVWDYNTNGDIAPGTGVGVIVVMLCISMGSSI